MVLVVPARSHEQPAEQSAFPTAAWQVDERNLWGLLQLAIKSAYPPMFSHRLS